MYSLNDNHSLSLTTNNGKLPSCSNAATHELCPTQFNLQSLVLIKVVQWFEWRNCNNVRYSLLYSYCNEKMKIKSPLEFVNTLNKNLKLRSKWGFWWNFNDFENIYGESQCELSLVQYKSDLRSSYRAFSAFRLILSPNLLSVNLNFSL